MSRVTKILLLLLSVLLLAQCEQNNWGDYYDRPTWLGPPLLQTLEQAGNFTQYVSCVKRTGYAIDRSGSYTLFAPNDEAFMQYLQERGLSSADELSDKEATQLVAYSLVINPFSLDQLTTFQDATYGEERVAFKRTTMMYDGMMFRDMFKHTDDGTEYIANDSTFAYYNQNKYNTNSTPGLSSGFDIDDKGFKYIPYFLERLNGFTENDYAAFYGAGRYIGANVADAQMILKNGEPVQAENGLIYELDRVVPPLPTLDDLLLEDQTLTDNAGYGKFRRLIEEYSSSVAPTTLVEFIEQEQLSSSAQNQYPGLKVYVKLYSGSLAFAPNVESYTTTYGNKSGQRYGYVLLAPNNAAVDEFNAFLTRRANITLDKDTLLLEGAKVEADLTPIQLQFINAHMTTDFFWPSQFSGRINGINDFVAGTEEGQMDPTKVVDIRMASNGVLYGHNTYIRSAYFESVYSELYLNPKYYMHKQGVTSYGTDIRDDALNCLINDKSAQSRLTLFLMPNSLLVKDGFTYVKGSNSSPAFSNANMTASSATTRMNRLVNSHAVKRDAYEALVGDPSVVFKGVTPEAGADQWSGYGVCQAYSGDLIRYKDGKIQGIGNMDCGEFVSLAIAYDPAVSSSDGANSNAINGIAYEVQDHLIEFSPRGKVNNDAGAYSASLDVDGSAWLDHEKTPIFQRLMTDVEPDFEGMYNPDTLWFNPDVDIMSQWLNNARINTYNRVFMNNNDRIITVLIPTNAAVKDAVNKGYLEIPDINLDVDDIPLWLDTINWKTKDFGGIFVDAEDSLFWINQVRYFVANHVIIGNEFYEDNTTPVVSNYTAMPNEYRTSSSHEVSGARPSVRVRKNANNDLTYYTTYDEIQTLGQETITIKHESTVVADKSKGRNSYNMMGSKMVLHVIKGATSNDPGFLVYDKPAVRR